MARDRFADPDDPRGGWLWHRHLLDGDVYLDKIGFAFAHRHRHLPHVPFLALYSIWGYKMRILSFQILVIFAAVFFLAEGIFCFINALIWAGIESTVIGLDLIAFGLTSKKRMASRGFLGRWRSVCNLVSPRLISSRTSLRVP